LSTGLEHFNDHGGGSASSLPKRILAQGLTRIKGMDDIRKGFFYDVTKKTEVGKTMDVVVLAVNTKRILWEKGQKLPKCKSDDGVVPSPSIRNPVSHECAGCEFSQKDLIYEVVAYEPSGSQTFIIEAKSTQLKSVRAFVQAIRSKNKATRDFKVTLRSQEQSNDKGSWYTFAFEDIEPTPSNLREDVEHAYAAVTGDQDIADDDGTQTDEVPF
jgi:hypothetical protein